MARTHDTGEINCQPHKVPLFQRLAGDVLTRVRNQAHSKRSVRVSLFFNEGDAAEAFFVMLLRATEIRLS